MILSTSFRAGDIGRTVLDPFMGSGTTALESRLVGHHVVGLEVDPYARMIASASAYVYKNSEIKRLDRFVSELTYQIKKIRFSQKFVPDLENIEYWFPEENIKMLARIRRLIDEEFPRWTKEKLLILSAFGDIIRAASYAERQSLKPYISTRFPKIPGNPLALFESTLLKYILAAKDFAEAASSFPATFEWASGDACQFVLQNKVDVAISSPPYINAMDYVRCIRQESSWVGTADSRALRDIRKVQVGEGARVVGAQPNAEVDKIIYPYSCKISAIDSKRAEVVTAYFRDMYQNIMSVRESLKGGASYYLIVGNSVVRGVEVPTHELLAEMGKALGMSWSNYFSYDIRDHRTSIPRKDRGGKIRVEHVIRLTKPK
jgi:DNA modification methylase